MRGRVSGAVVPPAIGYPARCHDCDERGGDQLSAADLDARPARPSLLNQLVGFVLVGGFSALIDYGIYYGLLSLGLWIHGAKGVGFVAGTTTAYLLNRRLTFQARGSRARFAGFMGLYATTFAVNVGMNAVMLQLLPQAWWEITAAFVVAQGTATTLNFTVMRSVIFRQ
jgi:putative flippase GtrA